MNLLDAQILIDKLWLDHGMATRGWSFGWDRAKNRFGHCLYGKKLITMSSVLAELNSEEEMRDTILHEIAHALVGPGHKHDWIWRIKAQQIGAKPIACASSIGTVYPAPKFIGKCVSCGKEVSRFRMTKRVTDEAFHSRCTKVGTDNGKIEWRKA